MTHSPAVAQCHLRLRVHEAVVDHGDFVRAIATELCDYDSIIEKCAELGDETLRAFAMNKKSLSLLLQFIAPSAHVAYDSSWTQDPGSFARSGNT